MKIFHGFLGGLVVGLLIGCGASALYFYAKAYREGCSYEYKRVNKQVEEHEHAKMIMNYDKNQAEERALEQLRNAHHIEDSASEEDEEEYFDEDEDDEFMSYIPEPYPDGECPDPYVITENDMLTNELTINEIVIYDPVNGELRLPLANETVEEEDLELYFGPAIELIRNHEQFVNGHLFLRNERLEVDFDISWEDEEGG